MQLPFRFRSTRTFIALGALLGLTACDLYPDTGKWGGDLTVNDAVLSQTYTCAADADITHTETVISLNSLDVYCGSASMHWAPSALTRRGTGLFLGDNQVGQIYGDGTVQIEIPDPYENVQYPRHPDKIDITWTRMGEDLQFTLTEWYGPNARSMEASLLRMQ